MNVPGLSNAETRALRPPKEYDGCATCGRSERACDCPADPPRPRRFKDAAAYRVWVAEQNAKNRKQWGF